MQSTARFLMNPLVLFGGIWATSALLYTFQLSPLLIPKIGEVAFISILLVTFFAMGQFSSRLLPSIRILPSKDRWNSNRVALLILACFSTWSAATAYEIAVMGGFPLLWKLTGDPRSYMEFGIGTLHGFLNALLSATAIFSWAVYLISGERKYCLIPMAAILWSIAAMARQLTVSISVELILLWVLLHRISLGTVIIVAATSILGILGFGFMGDLRNGVGHIYEVADIPSDGALRYLPSGFAWVYLYITTPLANLANIVKLHSPSHDLMWSQTMKNLVPSILRYQVVDETVANQYWISPAFNVSTAFANPFLDWGYEGMFFISGIWGLIAGYFYRQSTKSILTVLAYTVVAQCTINSIFFNFLFALPVITQIPLLLPMVWLSGFNSLRADSQAKSAAESSAAICQLVDQARI